MKNLAILGLKSDQSLLNVKFLVASFINLVNLTLNLAFLNEAQTFLEYTNSIFMCLLTALLTACFAIVSYKINALLVLLKFAEESIDESE